MIYLFVCGRSYDRPTFEHRSNECKHFFGFFVPVRLFLHHSCGIHSNLSFAQHVQMTSPNMRTRSRHTYTTWASPFFSRLVSRLLLLLLIHDCSSCLFWIRYYYYYYHYHHRYDYSVFLSSFVRSPSPSFASFKLILSHLTVHVNANFFAFHSLLTAFALFTQQSVVHPFSAKLFSTSFVELRLSPIHQVIRPPPPQPPTFRMSKHTRQTFSTIFFSSSVTSPFDQSQREVANEYPTNVDSFKSSISPFSHSSSKFKSQRLLPLSRTLV